MPDRCCICFENIPQTYPKTSCGHLIHYKCLQHYQSSLRNHSVACPLCRNKISTYPRTRNQTRWETEIFTITALFKQFHNTTKQLEKILIMSNIFESMWKYRMIIRRSEYLTKIVKSKINMIDFDWLQKNATKKQYKFICQMANNIRRL